MWRSFFRAWPFPRDQVVSFERRRRAFLRQKRPRILIYFHRHGGVGGLQRSTQTLVRTFRARGLEVDMVYQYAAEPGPFSLEPEPGLRLWSAPEFANLNSRPPYDLFYAHPGSFSPSYWQHCLPNFRGVKVLNWQHPAGETVSRQEEFAFDLVHYESVPELEIPLPGLVCLPPGLTWRTNPDFVPPVSPYYLSVFNPYGEIKGLQHLEKALDDLDRPLIWCYDLRSLSASPEARAELREMVSQLQHPRLIKVESPTQEDLQQLYRHCDGYICFSEYESFGWAIADAIQQGKPVAGRAVGILRAVRDFKAWNAGDRLVFNRITGPWPDNDFLAGLQRHLRRENGEAPAPLRAEATAV